MLSWHLFYCLKFIGDEIKRAWAKNKNIDKNPSLLTFIKSMTNAFYFLIAISYITVIIWT
ncbi:hypothetical protein CXF58_03195 [Psychrobacter sp. Sarcosine-02u-2]|nr:hypothetical protein CXF58_03195 [Psychrobacter sp. Sarcosine-02u-2]